MDNSTDKPQSVNLAKLHKVRESNDKDCREEQIRLCKEFLDKYYPLSPCENVDIDYKKINRKVWYCNHSEIFIPELQQKYGDLSLIDIQIEEKPCIAWDFYCGNIENKKYNNYRVYPCGHCIIDVYYLCSLFDNINFRWHPPFTIQKAEDLINNFIKICPICQNHKYLGKENLYSGSLYLYYISHNLSTGTVILNPTFPKEYIKYLTNLFREGDVIDINGYRGVGLYILEDGTFKQVRTKEYYPIWPLKWLKKRGYNYYLSFNSCFDGLPFEKNIILNADFSETNKFYNFNEDKTNLLNKGESDNEINDEINDGLNDELDENEIDTEENDAEEIEDNLENDINNNNIANKKEYDIINLNSGSFVDYPFLDAKQANEYVLKSKYETYFAKLNQNEILVFKKRKLYLIDYNGKILNKINE